MKHILIYSPKDSPRLRYILDLIFHQILGKSNWELTFDWEEFKVASSVAKLNYSFTPIQGIPQLLPHGLLWEKGIHPQSISPRLCMGRMAAFFADSNHASPSLLYPFDLFSWVFYLVSRYEEYLPFEADDWGRFPATSSLAFQKGFLQRPLVNEWVLNCAEQLQQFYPRLQFNKQSYQFTPTYDIDHAFAFAYKPWWRQMGALARSVVQRDTESLRLRLATYRAKAADPYNVYSYIRQLTKRYQCQPIFFWLVGDYGSHDKNLSPSLPIMQKLIRQQANYGATGLHPSFGSNNSFGTLQEEISRLQRVLQSPIQHSRQHYLRLHLPETYQRLLQLGIKKDYSMGYARALGFRASIATPFAWYDLEQERATKLYIHPFMVMDVTLNTYLKLSPTQAIDAFLPLVESCKVVQGHFIPIWHNSSLCEAWQWKGWRTVYETLLEVATCP